MKLDKDSLKVYLITDRSWTDGEKLLNQIEDSIISGTTIIQIREKNISFEKYVERAKEIQDICLKHSIPFIVNDNVDVAIRVNADGVHVGQSDLIANKVRKLIDDNKILGVSASNLKQAILAEEMGADYIGVGAIFNTTTKLDASSVSIEELKKICNTVKIPVVAIGGIDKNNIYELKNSGVSGVSVISAILSKKNIKDATKKIKEEIEKIL